MTWETAPGLDELHLPDLNPVDGAKLPPELVEAAGTAWTTAGTMLDEGIALLAKHKAESPACPGPWCPGVHVEASIQQMQRWQLEALLSVALFRLWEQAP